MASLTLVIKTNKDTSEMTLAGQPQMNMQRICNLLNGLKAGALRGEVVISTSSADPVAASGTLTLTSAVATDKVTIGAVDLTASSTPANENEWEIDGADDAADAAALAACINAHSVLSKVVSAESSSNVVTITALIPGVMGNQIPLSSADSTIVASASFLASGAGGAGSAPLTVGR